MTADTITGPELSDRDRALLDFERDWAAYRGAKRDHIAERFGFTATRYYQLLSLLLDRPEAERYDPLLIRRLRRRRDERASAARATNRAGGQPRGGEATQ